MHCYQITSGHTHVCDDCGFSLCNAAHAGVTLLLQACEQGDARAARKLLDTGASINVTRIDMEEYLSTTALIACVRAHNCHVDCIDVLLACGADPLARDSLREPGYSAIDRVHERIAWHHGYLRSPDLPSAHRLNAENSLSTFEVVLDRLMCGRPVWRRLRTLHLWTTLVRPACLAWRLRAAERTYAPDGEGYASVMRGPQAATYATWSTHGSTRKRKASVDK